VVYDYDADYEGVISVDQGYKIGTEEVPAEYAIAFVAGASAGANLNVSNTYKVISGATEIIGEKTNAEIEEGLKTGKFIFSKRPDRAIVCEKDINTLHNFTATRTQVFSKNTSIRVMDSISTTITNLFTNQFIGKIYNTTAGRNLFKSGVVNYLNTLVAMDAIYTFDPATDITITIGNDAESVVVELWITLIGMMEKLYMAVYVK
jgi:hypothetical protein